MIESVDDESDDEVPILRILPSDDHKEQPRQLPPVPVTILSGFLGSGKTTLLKHILSSPDHGKRIAVIENEFGEGLAIESLIARDNDMSDNSLTDLIELPNGCVCCTVKDNLVVTLENLLAKRQELDYILIECSGMANPGPIASLFWLDDALESRIRLDGIVTLVDAANIESQLKSTEEAAQQVAFADRLILNKCDLIQSQDRLERIKAAVQSINPLSPILATTFSAVEQLERIMDANCFDATRAMSLYNESEDFDNISFFLPPHKHTNRIVTLSLNHEGSVDLDKMNAWLASLLWPNQDARDSDLRSKLEASVETPGDIHSTKAADDQSSTSILFRIKGVLSVRHNSPDEEDFGEFIDSTTNLDRRRFICQAVHDLWEINPVSNDALFWKSHEQRSCKLVMIGRHLDRLKLEEDFLQCFSAT